MASQKILIIDNEPVVRTMLGTLLRKSGYAVETADEGRDVLQRMTSGSCDLLLCDLMMPGMDGLELLDHLKVSQVAVPVVIITAVHDAAVAIAAMRKGAFDVLLKPFEKDLLLETVRRALEYGSTSRQSQSYRQGLEQLVEARTSMLRQAIVDLEQSYDITLEALGDALDLKDSETEGHSRRVTAYTIALARAMGLESSEIKTVARGAFLHDIGKMAIPDAILLKPGRLDNSEQTIMREHCLSGYLIVRKIPFLREASEIVYSHQEHYNGTGYPRHLKGEDIPLGARIFAVADTLDAITSDRPYRKGTTFLAARDEILRCSGTQFDPQVVNAFVAMPSEIWEDLRAEIQQRGRS